MWTLLLALALSGQAAHICDADAPGPFIVQSARAFTVQWCTALTRPNPSDPTQTINERVDGHYIQLDNGPKVDVAATDLGVSTVTNRRGWQHVVSSGLPRGSHVVTVSSWNYVLDENGAPTSTRQESGPTPVPFTVVDPVPNLPPLAPSGVRVIR
jgi:hypothetical protein